VSPIRAVLDAGISTIVLEAAAHEVGHGICWQTAGFSVAHLKVTEGWLGGLDAYCELTRTAHLDPGNAEGYLTGLMGGWAAHHHLHNQHLARGGSSPRRGAAHDLAEFGRLGRHHAPRYRPDAALTRASAVLARYGWARVDRLTARLAQDGRLSGGAL
jgi:hypothetical protein